MLCLFSARPVTGTESLGSSLGTAPVLLVLQLAADEAGEKRESRFAEELAMILESVAVVPARSPLPQFEHLSFGDQIARLRPIMEAHGALAAVWMTESQPGQLLLHLLVLKTGRALVRMIEIEAVDGFETDLALSTKELLGTAFLFEKIPPSEDKSLERVVESVREKASRSPDGLQDAAMRAPVPRRSEWAVRADAVFSGGLVSAQGPSLSLGANIGLERRLVQGLRAYLALGLSGGPLNAGPSHVRIDWVSIAPGLGLSYLWHFGRLSLGPAIEGHARWSSFSVIIEEDVGSSRSETQVFRIWQLRGSVSLEARVDALEFLSVAFAGGLVATPQQDIFQRIDSKEVILATYHLGYTVRVGFLFSY